MKNLDSLTQKNITKNKSKLKISKLKSNFQ
jgi:hypothetical protein